MDFMLPDWRFNYELSLNLISHWRLTTPSFLEHFLHFVSRVLLISGPLPHLMLILSRCWSLFLFLFSAYWLAPVLFLHWRYLLHMFSYLHLFLRWSRPFSRLYIPCMYEESQEPSSWTADSNIQLPLDISLWMSYRLLKINMSQTELLIPYPSSLLSTTC